LQRILEGNPTLCATIRADQIKRLPVGNRCGAAKENILHKIGSFINQSLIRDGDTPKTLQCSIFPLQILEIRTLP